MIRRAGDGKAGVLLTIWSRASFWFLWVELSFLFNVLTGWRSWHRKCLVDITIRCCGVLTCMILQDDQHSTTVCSWWLSEIHNWATKVFWTAFSLKQSEKECAVYSATQWNKAMGEILTVSSHLIFLGPPYPLSPVLQFLKDILAYFGLFFLFRPLPHHG